MKSNFRFFCFMLLFVSFIGKAQDTLTKNQNNNYYDLSLEELMNIKISVASVKELTPRESPGIVTLITEDDIKNLGARDLIDVLRIIPGFDFGVDVEGVVSIGVRGNWAHEGKILLLIDGQEMNENLYSTIQLGNHYPLDNIERIEIIRGPGSAIYGGVAEYAVINMISKKGKDLEGANVSTSYGQTSKTFGHRNINVSTGAQQKDFSYSFSTYVGQANRSDQEYSDVYGTDYNMAHQSGIDNAYINLGMNFKDFQLRGIVDNYSLFTRDAYQQTLSKAYQIHFPSYFLELKKDVKINDRFSVTPQFNYKNQTPWAFNEASEGDEFAPFKINSERYSGNLTGNFNASDHVNIISGAGYYKDIATQKTGDVFFISNSEKFQYETFAAFAQTLIRTRIAIFTAGARYNYNSLYAASFVPRLGITKTFDRFHAKGLFSKAFRAPNTQNINLNPEIKPENTTVFEAETGYEINQKMFVTLNVFDITTKDPIIYYYDDLSESDAYVNYNKTGTRGFEIEYKYKNKGGYSGVNYSFYSPTDHTLANYAVPSNNHALLAFPVHKINFTAGIKISDHLKLNSAISFSGPRYGIVSIDELTGDTVVKKFKPCTLANLNLNYDNLFVKGLSVTIGVSNLFDDKDVFIQPYNNLHTPLPSGSREFLIKLSYHLNFKRN